MNEYSEFFRFDEHAHLTSFVVHVSTLFDKGRDTVRLSDILAKSRSKYPSKSKQLALPDRVPKTIMQTAEKVLVLRHAAFAHRSKEFSYDEAFKRAKVTYDELLQLTNETANLLNLILQTQGRSQFSFWEYHKTHLQKLMADLKQFNREQT